MSLTCNGSHRSGLLHLAFNQDNSCIAVGTSEGIKIYNIDTHQICFKNNIGAVGYAYTRLAWRETLHVFQRSRHYSPFILTVFQQQLFVSSKPAVESSADCPDSQIALSCSQDSRDAVLHQPGLFRGSR